MTTPAWMPPQLPEVIAPEPEPPGRQRIVVLSLGIACILAFGLGATAWKFRSVIEPAPETSRPLEIVDEVVADMVSGRWDSAYGRFSTNCAEFSPEALRAGFEPVLATYRGLELDPLRRSDFSAEEIVLVFGQVDLGNARLNPIRAEFVFVGAGSPQPWTLCGLRIDEP